MSKRGYARVQRGMVFWFSSDDTYHESLEYEGYNGKMYKTNVQRGKRPCMVVSNNDGNYSSTTCNIVPITLEDKTEIPVHVHFMYEGRRQTILCEQMKTVDIMALKDYIYTVSDEILEKVERALAIQYNIRPVITYADFKLERTIKNLESVISSIIHSKVDSMQQAESRPIPVKDIEDTAIRLSQMIEDLVVAPTATAAATDSVTKVSVNTTECQKKEEPKNNTTVSQSVTISTKPTSQIDKFNSRLQKSKDMGASVHHTVPNPVQKAEPKQTVEPTTKTKRNVWTPERRQAYLDDYDKMSPKEMMKKYNLSSIQSVMQTKYACRNALGKHLGK